MLIPLPRLLTGAQCQIFVIWRQVCQHEQLSRDASAMRCRRSGPQAVVSRRLLICRGCVRSCSNIALELHSMVHRRRSWKRSSGKPGMTRRHRAPP